MNIIESFSAAIKSVTGNKMRSILTMLGIIIGIAAVIMIMGVGQGVRNTIFSLVENIDKRFIEVYVQNWESNDDNLTFADKDAVTKIEGVKSVSALNQFWGMDLLLMRPDEVLNGAVIGVDENYGAIEKYEMQLGRFINENDVENRLSVVVLQPHIAVQVFGYLDCIGEKIQISFWGGIEEFTVIGILAGPTEQSNLDQMMAGGTPLKRSIAVVPIKTLNQIFDLGDDVDFFGVSVEGQYSTAEISKAITTLLDIRHSSQDKYYAQSLESMFDMVETVIGAVTGFIAFVAAISLFVGGVGVMNIMLVSVKERTREIGIRKALGATENNIKFQFLLESVTLSLFGGVIGILLGWGLSIIAGNIITSLMETSVVPVISVNVITLACGVSMLVGIIFGVYPAGKAAKLDPIEALRYE